MSRYLLALALGPVQDAIAAGRRIADLQEGSRLLVTLAQAAAHSLEANSAQLIFPASSDDPGAPNKLLAALPEGVAPESAAEAAEKAVRDELRRQREAAWKALDAEQRALIDKERFEAQIEGFLEFYAAWLPLESEGSYGAVRKELDRLLAARKSLRAFPPSAGVAGVPKSPLNPAYETALKQEARRSDVIVDGPLTRRPLFLKGGELLDGISLMKRINGHEWAARQNRASRVPSTAEMAMRSVYPALRERASDALEQLEELIKQHGLYPEYDLGDLFFPNRVDGEKELVARLVEDPSVHEEIKRLRRELLRAAGRSVAPPYYALLLADGDNMGRLLESCDSIEGHIALSEALRRFSEQASERIREGYEGYPVYLGGDDVLALVPLDRAIACAAELHTLFGATLTPLGLHGTLSAGIAIIHYLEPLQRGLDKMRTAEKAAKSVSGKDALAVALHPRGGEPITHAAPWSGNANVAEWDRWTRAFRGDLARGLPFELKDLADQIQGPKGFEPVAISGEMLSAELRRVIGRKEGGGAFVEDEENRAALEAVTDGEALKKLAERLRIARFLASPEADR